MTRTDKDIWDEYDATAEWCAKRRLSGHHGDPLPALISHDTLHAINDDPEAFQERVRLTAYMLACNEREESTQ